MAWVAVDGDRSLGLRADSATVYDHTIDEMDGVDKRFCDHKLSI